MLKLDDVKAMVAQIDEPILSLYLNVNPAAQENQSNSPAWRVFLRNAIQDLDTNLSNDDKTAWESIKQRVESDMSGYEPSAKTVVLFYGESFEQRYDLPVQLENRIAFGKPLTAPLLWAIDEYEPYLIAMIDQEEAHFFTASLGTVGFQDSIELDLNLEEWRDKTSSGMGRGDGAGRDIHGGSGRDDYDARVDEHINRLYRDVVAHIEKITTRENLRRVILAGNELSAHAVKNLMTDKQAEMIAGIVAIPNHFSPAEILDAVGSVALNYERQTEYDLVEQVINFAKSGGRGALGRDGVMDALEMQRVELLVLPWPLDDDELATELPLLAFQSGGSVELVHGAAADMLQQEGGVAARLYYALEVAQ